MLPATVPLSVAADLEPGMAVINGPAAAIEAEVAAVLLATPPVVMAVGSEAVDVLAALGLLFWVIPLLVWIARDVSHAAHRVHLHHDRPSGRRHATPTDHHQAGVRR